LSAGSKARDKTYSRKTTIEAVLSWTIHPRPTFGELRTPDISDASVHHLRGRLTASWKPSFAVQEHRRFCGGWPPGLHDTSMVACRSQQKRGSWKVFHIEQKSIIADRDGYGISVSSTSYLSACCPMMKSTICAANEKSLSAYQLRIWIVDTLNRFDVHLRTSVSPICRRSRRKKLA